MRYLWKTEVDKNVVCHIEQRSLEGQLHATSIHSPYGQLKHIHLCCVTAFVTTGPMFQQELNHGRLRRLRRLRCWCLPVLLQTSSSCSCYFQEPRSISASFHRKTFSRKTLSFCEPASASESEKHATEYSTDRWHCSVNSNVTIIVMVERLLRRRRCRYNCFPKDIQSNFQNFEWKA